MGILEKIKDIEFEVRGDEGDSSAATACRHQRRHRWSIGAAATSTVLDPFHACQLQAVNKRSSDPAFRCRCLCCL
jgi:hypothetical protein